MLEFLNFVAAICSFWVMGCAMHRLRKMEPLLNLKKKYYPRLGICTYHLDDLNETKMVWYLLYVALVGMSMWSFGVSAAGALSYFECTVAVVVAWYMHMTVPSWRQLPEVCKA
jgi:hypothetical protein